MHLLLVVLLVVLVHISCAFISQLHPSSQSHSISSLHTSSLDSVGGDGTIVWQMHRDESDEWLDQVLIERSSGMQSIFSVSSLVVESFISNHTNDNDSRPVLRRVSNFNDSALDDTLFGPLFGIYNTRNDDVDKILPTKVTRTSKKNRKRTNLKITLAYRGLDFCGWEDQRHELYRKNNNSSSSSSITSNNQQLLPSVQGTLADILGPAVGSSLNTKPTSPRWREG